MIGRRQHGLLNARNSGLTPTARPDRSHGRGGRGRARWSTVWRRWLRPICSHGRGGRGWWLRQRFEIDNIRFIPQRRERCSARHCEDGDEGLVELVVDRLPEGLR